MTRQRDPEPYAEDILRRRGRHEPDPVYEVPEPLPRCENTIRYADGGWRQCPYNVVRGGMLCTRCQGVL